MDCPIHGQLNPGWTSCPFCIRERRTMGPQQPRFDSPRYGGGGGGADVTRGGGGQNRGAADVTRGGGGGVARDDRADVTHGAENLDGRGAFRGSTHTRIVDPPQKRIRAWLIEKNGPRPDQIFQIKDDETWIGSDRRNDIFIDHDTVSSQHAKLWVDEKRVLRLMNVSTTNGTQVNGVRVQAPVELLENDEIKMGETVFILKRIDTPVRDEPPSRSGDETITMPSPGGAPGGGV